MLRVNKITMVKVKSSKTNQQGEGVESPFLPTPQVPFITLFIACYQCIGSTVTKCDNHI